MKTFHLHGSLERFGGPYEMQVPTARHGVRLLAVQMPDLMDSMRTGRFHVVHGRLDAGMELDEETVAMSLPDGEVHVVPIVEGQDSGFFNIILGAALVGIALIPGAIPAAGLLGQGVLTAGAIGGLGVSLALSGAAQLLAPTPTVQSNEPVERRPSALFNSLLNRTEAGNPVPLAFGKVRTGSVVASVGVATEEVPAANSDSGSGKFLEPFAS